jgi:hypothetical protein
MPSGQESQYPVPQVLYDVEAARLEVVLEEMPETSARQCPDVRAVVNDYVEAFGRALGGYAVEQRRVLLFARIDAYAPGGVFYAYRG